MDTFIDPFNDWAFKHLFGKEEAKELLIDFLNDLLEGERVITDLTYLNKEQTPDSLNGRVCIYDIYCTTDTGEHIIVEMQNKDQKNFKDRALFYMCEAIVAQGQKGEDWPYEFEAVYGIFFMIFPFKDSKKFRTDIVLSDRETERQFSDKIRQIFLCLKYFDIENPTDCKTGLEKWIYVLKTCLCLQLCRLKNRRRYSPS